MSCSSRPSTFGSSGSPAVADKLFPLDLPPGLFRNGTELQARGRWYDGDLVRFFQGTIQPVGGYVQRTLTGAAIVGEPNAAIAWETNDGTSWLAVGTDSKLYVIGSDNVVHDITPIMLPAVTHDWQLAVFGSYLIAVDSLTAYNATYGVGAPPYANTYYWSGDIVAMPAATTAFDANGPWPGPQSVYGVVVTPERFLMLIRGADPNGRTARTTAAGAAMIN